MDTSVLDVVIDSGCYTTYDFLSPFGCDVCGKRGGLRKVKDYTLCPCHRKVIMFIPCLGKRYLNSLREDTCSYLGFSGRCKRIIYKDKRRCNLHRDGGLESFRFF